MKTSKAAVLVLAFAVSAMPAASAIAAEKLSLYNWFEYMPQELLDKFAAETGIDATMDTYDSNEAMLASLKAGALGDYDLAVPGDYMVKIMADEGLLDEFAPTELKNFGNIEEQWRNVNFDPGRKHSIPYQWGSTSFSVDRAVYKGDIRTTELLFNPPPELSGKINMLDSQGEVLALASLHLGIAQCSNDRAELKTLDNLLQNAKKHWASFGSDTAKDLLVSGDVAAGMIYNGFSAKARAEKPTIEYSYPRQGFIVWMDNIVLLKNAPNRDNALKFMDFMLRPENVAVLTNFAQYAAGVKGVGPYLTEELRTSPESVPPANAKGSFIEVCAEETQVLYDAIWQNLKK
ncbi:MAG: extracellular solute-binding protein [Gammaproteobacteria bacterium]